MYVEYQIKAGKNNSEANVNFLKVKANLVRLVGNRGKILQR